MIVCLLSWVGVAGFEPARYLGWGRDAGYLADLLPGPLPLLEHLGVKAGETQAAVPPVVRAEDSRLPARCPAIDVSDRAHFTGRQVRIHVVEIGQMVIARAAGSSEARENTAGIRILGQPTPSHWKMLVAQHPFPSRVTPRPGRVYAVKADAVLETQIAMLTGAEARGLALGGTVTQCPDGMPYRAWHPRVAAAGVIGQITDTQPPDQGNYQLRPVPVTGPDSGVTLSEAVETGLLKTSIHNARMLRCRRTLGQNDMPLPIGKRGTADVWDAIALADWWGMRDARRMTGQGAA